jgi:transglutaminase-like putative cysteine protease
VEQHLHIYLRPTQCIDSDTPEVIDFARFVSGDETTDIGKAIKMYYAVRDGITYDPHRIDFRTSALKASVVLARKYGFCISKAILLAALARAEGIPSRLGFADVRNHLSTPNLRELMQTDIFVFHGYAELFLENKWVKATPAFNKSLCDRFDVEPLEFDGRNDSIFHQFDRKGKLHMEYVRDHGQFADLPHSKMVEEIKKNYPVFFSQKDGRYTWKI